VFDKSFCVEYFLSVCYSWVIIFLHCRKLSYCHLAQMKYLFPEAIQIKRVLLHDEKSLCMYADMKIILVMDVVEYTSPDHSPSMAICDAFYSKLLTFSDAHHKVLNLIGLYWVVVH
jgi:hypothetical protein